MNSINQQPKVQKLVWILHLAAWILIFVLSYWWFRKQRDMTGLDQAFPNRPIQIVVPYAAGGGSDTFVRVMQQGLQAAKAFDQPLVILNQPGGIGTIGSREVKNATPDGYKLLCHHNAIITAKLAETVDYGPEAFEAIALTGEMSMVVLVRADSPIKDLKQLLLKSAEDPKSVRFAANKGAPAYFSALQLEKAVEGAQLTIVSSGGGADRYTKIIGGHLDAGIFSLSEYLDFLGPDGTPPERDIRAIAVLSLSRHESIPEVPTATELGVPVVLSNANYWWAPKGTPKPVLERIASALADAMSQPIVIQELKRLRLDATFAVGEELRGRLDETIQAFEQVAENKSVKLPPFDRYMAWLVLGLFVFVVVESAVDKRSKRLLTVEESGKESDSSRFGLAATAFVLVLLHVGLIQSGWVPLAVAITSMVLVLGLSLARHVHVPKLCLLEIALLCGLGTQYVFSEILMIALPG